MALLSRPKHTHTARIMRWADGDTVVMLIDLDFGVWVEKYLRLEGIESFEPTGPHADKAKQIRLELNNRTTGRDCLVHLRSHGHDRYGRLTGRATLGERDLAAWLVETGYAWPATLKDSAAAHRAGKQHQPGPKETPPCTERSESLSSAVSSAQQVTSQAAPP